MRSLSTEASVKGRHTEAHFSVYFEYVSISSASKAALSPHAYYASHSSIYYEVLLVYIEGAHPLYLV